MAAHGSDGSHESAEDKLESLLISSAKEKLEDDLPAAKAWLLTARVMYPHKFEVQVRILLFCAKADAGVSRRELSFNLFNFAVYGVRN